MASRYRSASIFIGSKRYVKTDKFDFTVKKNGEDIFDDDGWDGYSDGPVTCSLKISGAIPFSGDGMNIEETLPKGKYVKVVLATINGRKVSVEMVITESTYSSDRKAGKVDGSISLNGGQPEYIG